MTSSTDKTMSQRVQEAITRALNLPPEACSAPLQMGSTPGWDSMGHMLVVMELEKEFQTVFPPYRLPQLVDVPSILNTLQGSV